MIKPLLTCILLGTILSGCASMTVSMGIRPSEPVIKGTEIKDTGKACDEYAVYVEYAQGLQEAYHSRATQNRNWIYVAGITGLGVMAASGALGVAAAASVGTLALLSISGGFAAATFATINNSELANAYTVSANQVDTALKVSEQTRLGAAASPDGCRSALKQLRAGVSEARVTLELSRTSNAVLALRRALAEREALQKLVNDQQDLVNADRDAAPTQVRRSGSITGIEPDTEVTSGQAKTFTLTVSNVQLNRVPVTEVRVAIGSKIVEGTEVTKVTDSDFTYKVTFDAPRQPPDEGVTKYAPVLLVGPTKQRVSSAADVFIEYKPAQ